MLVEGALNIFTDGSSRPNKDGGVGFVFVLVDNWEEDNQGNVLSCVQTSTEDNSLTITRLTFGD